MATKSTTSSKFAASESYSAVSTTTELEFALSTQVRHIFLKSGPTYNLTQQIVPYDGITLEGENLPSQSTNNAEDGVLLFYGDDEVIDWYSPADSYAGMVFDDRERGDDSIYCLSGATATISAGSILVIDNFAYLVTQDTQPISGDLGNGVYWWDTIYVRDKVAHNATGGTSFNVYPADRVLQNFTIDSLMIDDDYGSGTIRVHGFRNLTVTNFMGVNRSDDVFDVRYGVDLFCNNIHVGNARYEMYIRSVNNFRIEDIGELFYDDNDDVMDGSYLANGTISNCRGSSLDMYGCYNMEISNCHCVENNTHYFSYCHHFSVHGCSSLDTFKGFQMGTSTNFTVNNCNAPNAVTPIDIDQSTDYQVYGNLWQGDTMKIKLIDWNVNPKESPYVARLDDMNTKFLTTEQWTGVIIDTVVFHNEGSVPEGVFEFHGDRGYIYSQNSNLFQNEAPNLATTRYLPDYNPPLSTIAHEISLSADNGYQQAFYVTNTGTVWDIRGLTNSTAWVNTGISFSVWEQSYMRLSFPTLGSYTALYRWTLGDGQTIGTRKSSDDWYRYGENLLPSTNYRNMPLANGDPWTATGLSPFPFAPNALLHLQGIEGMDEDTLKISQPVTKGGNTIFACRARGNFQFNNYSNDDAMTLNQWDNNEDVLRMGQYGLGRCVYYYQNAEGICSQYVFSASVGNHIAGSFTGDFLRFTNKGSINFTVNHYGNCQATAFHAYGNSTNNYVAHFEDSGMSGEPAWNIYVQTGEHNIPSMKVSHWGSSNIIDIDDTANTEGTNIIDIYQSNYRDGNVLYANMGAGGGEFYGNFIKYDKNGVEQFSIDDEGHVEARTVRGATTTTTGVSGFGHQINFNDGDYHHIGIDGDIGIMNYTGQVSQQGRTGIVEIEQDAVGGHVINSISGDWPNGQPSLGTNPYDVNVLRYTVLNYNRVFWEFLYTWNND